ncbi:MAG TPA: STAS domain-containing protein [Amycolatopsis sp.]|nr:STAS domain-containing protein [Amycolatopsis sp.]
MYAGSPASGGHRVTSRSPWTAQLMRVEVCRPTSRTALVRVSGEIDLSTAARLDAELNRQVTGPVTRLVVDLSQVTFLAVSGLNCLIHAQFLAREYGLSFAVDPGESRAVQRVFELLELPFTPAPGAARLATEN